MKQVPIYWEEQELGELRAEEEGLYTRFTASCRLPDPGLWCVWAVGERGELKVGIMEPRGDRASISRRFSGEQTAGLGPLRSADLRPGGQQENSQRWQSPEQPETWFRTPWLREQLRGQTGLKLARQGEGCRVAIPYQAGKPFPLVQLFCLARVELMEGKPWVIYTFDREERPILEQSGH